MNNIARRAEQALQYKEILQNRSKISGNTITDAIGQSVAHTALNLEAAAIVTPTESGHTARMISKYRPKAPIIAVTSDPGVQRRLSLVWGVMAQLGEEASTTDEMLDLSVQQAMNTGLITHGDLIVITAGVPVGETGTTNLMKVHVVGDIITKGQGIGRKTAFGKVVIANSGAEANEKMKEGNILVTNSTDRDMMGALEKAVALIVEEGGLTSHAAVVGLSLGIPVIVGVEDATSILKDGQDVTVDASRGTIYNGHASVL